MDIIWTNALPEKILISGSQTLPSGKWVDISIWLKGKQLYAFAVDGNTGLCVMPYYLRETDAMALEAYVWRYAHELCKPENNRTVH